MKVIAVIPCFNEALYIGDLVFELNQLAGMVMVTDDNSTDKTAEKADEAGAYVIRHFGKRGFGSNTERGINSALVQECDIVVTLDGDGQHNPKDLPRVIEPIEKGEADVVVGSRFLGDNHTHIPRYRRFGIKVITWLFNIGSKQKITDAQCCFRAYKQEVLRAMDIKEEGFTFSTETLIQARALGYRIKETPISVLYHRQFSQNSTLNPIVQGFCVACGTIRVRLVVELLPKIRKVLRKR